MRLEAGEFVALLGRSGSGKTTLLRILAGLDRGAYGDIRVPSSRSVVFQDARLLPWAPVLANVIIGQRGRDAVARGRSALQEVGLAGHEDDWPKTLSGGEAQRVALARALCVNRSSCFLTSPLGRSTRLPGSGCRHWCKGSYLTTSRPPSSSPTTSTRPCCWPIASWFSPRESFP